MNIHAECWELRKYDEGEADIKNLIAVGESFTTKVNLKIGWLYSAIYTFFIWISPQKLTLENFFFFTFKIIYQKSDTMQRIIRYGEPAETWTSIVKYISKIIRLLSIS